MLATTLLFIRMGIRNALKYGRRNLLVAGVVAIGVGSMAVFGCIARGFFGDIMARFVENTSHARVFAAGYYAKRELNPLDMRIENWRETAARLAAMRPHTRVSASITAGAFVSAHDNSNAAMVTGIEPYDSGAHGLQLFPSYREYARRIAAGRFFESNATKGVVLGADLAQRLGVVPGDSVVLFTSDAYGSFQGVELELIGAVRMADREVNENLCIIDLSSMQYLLGTEGAATELLVFLDNIGAVEQFRLAASNLLASHSLEMYSWRELLGSFMYLLDMSNNMLMVFYVIFFGVSVVGITNVVLITVMNRIRDIGTLRAIGFTHANVAWMLIIEVLCVGIAGASVGLLVSSPLLYYFQSTGLSMPADAADMMTWAPRVIYGRVTALDLTSSMLIGSLVPPIAALYPILVVRAITIREALSRA